MANRQTNSDSFKSRLKICLSYFHIRRFVRLRRFVCPDDLFTFYSSVKMAIKSCSSRVFNFSSIQAKGKVLHTLDYQSLTSGKSFKNLGKQTLPFSDWDKLKDLVQKQCKWFSGWFWSFNRLLLVVSVYLVWINSCYFEL